MLFSHVLSDLVLFLAGCFAMVLCLATLSRTMIWLWASFLVPVSLAALFGALRFAGVHANMVHVSEFFQQVALTIGSCGLMLGALGLVSQGRIHPPATIICLCVGLILFFLLRWFNVSVIKTSLPQLAMLVVLVLGIAGVAGRRRASGCMLILAVILAALAAWALGGMENRYWAVDVYHYLMALSIISFGLSAMLRPQYSWLD